MASSQNDNSGGLRSVLKLLVYVSQFGINMLVPIVLCFLLGLWMDKRFETSFIAIVLFFIGAAAGARNVYRMAKKHMGKDGEIM